jgi:L-serine dehydratase
MSVSAFPLGARGASRLQTDGPMIAACRFASHVEDANLLSFVTRVRVACYGSLGTSGQAQGIDAAMLVGLEGHLPESIDHAAIVARRQAIDATSQLRLLGKRSVRFDRNVDITFHPTPLAVASERNLSGTTRAGAFAHPDGMRFQAFDAHAQMLVERDYYVVEGRVVNRDGDVVSDWR